MGIMRSSKGTVLSSLSVVLSPNERSVCFDLVDKGEWFTFSLLLFPFVSPHC